MPTLEQRGRKESTKKKKKNATEGQMHSNSARAKESEETRAWKLELAPLSTKSVTRGPKKTNRREKSQKLSTSKRVDLIEKKTHKQKKT